MAAISAAGIAAVNCVALTNVVFRSAPFHWTTAPETKLDPLTVNVKSCPPVTTVVGVIEVSLGSGFVMLTPSELEVPPPCPGLNTVTTALPEAVRSLAGIAAFN